MTVEIYAPSDYAGDLMGDLNGRRGRISGMDTRGATTVIRAQVPMAEMLTYEQQLTSATGGRGSYHMEYSHYEEVPQPPAAEDHRGGQGRAGGGRSRGSLARRGAGCRMQGMSKVQGCNVRPLHRRTLHIPCTRHSAPDYFSNTTLSTISMPLDGRHSSQYAEMVMAVRFFSTSFGSILVSVTQDGCANFFSSTR